MKLNLLLEVRRKSRPMTEGSLRALLKRGIEEYQDLMGELLAEKLKTIPGIKIKPGGKRIDLENERGTEYSMTGRSSRPGGRSRSDDLIWDIENEEDTVFLVPWAQFFIEAPGKTEEELQQFVRGLKGMFKNTVTGHQKGMSLYKLHADPTKLQGHETRPGKIWASSYLPGLTLANQAIRDLHDGKSMREVIEKAAK